MEFEDTNAFVISTSGEKAIGFNFGKQRRHKKKVGEEVVEVGRIVGKGDRGGAVRHGQGRLSSDLLARLHRRFVFSQLFHENHNTTFYLSA